MSVWGYEALNIKFLLKNLRFRRVIESMLYVTATIERSIQKRIDRRRNVGNQLWYDIRFNRNRKGEKIVTEKKRSEKVWWMRIDSRDVSIHLTFGCQPESSTHVSRCTPWHHTHTHTHSVDWACCDVVYFLPYIKMTRCVLCRAR